MCWEVWEMENIIETWTLTQGCSSPSGECEWCLQQPGPGFSDLQLYCLQDIFRSTQPWLLLWYWYLILLCHQDFKLWNSVRPQTLIFLSFSYLLIFSLTSRELQTPWMLMPEYSGMSIQLCLGFTCLFLAWIPWTSEVTKDHQVAAESQLNCPPTWAPSQVWSLLFIMGASSLKGKWN